MIDQETPPGTVNIGRISYINVSPVYYGLDRNTKPAWLSMVTEPPAVLNRMLEQNNIVMSPVSSAAYAKNHDSWLLIPDVSISSFGKVMSVILASHYSLDDLHGRPIIFTEESATAANLVRYILARRKVFPHIETRKITTPVNMADQADAVLVIGDAALTENWQDSFEHVFDLGEIWNDMTGLPFVYAVWAIRRDYAQSCPRTLSLLKDLFLESKRLGDEHKDEIVLHASLKTGLTKERCRDYFQHLNCDFGPLHLKGLSTFFDGLYVLGLIPEKVRIEMA
ncbi:MAG: menaquinone biosynthesis protein [Proteobacteria bacterium]|nr:menaquinone biosynthesis protein [Pseudomonadota bacterium]